jgi:hypothetical protein
MKYDRIFESVVNDFNISDKELLDLNNATLELVFKAVKDSKHTEKVSFRENVMDPIEERVKADCEVTSHLEDTGHFIVKTVAVYDDRLADEIEGIFDIYDKTYTCIATGGDVEEIFKLIKDALPIIEDWEFDLVDGKLTYVDKPNDDTHMTLVVDDLIDLAIFERDTVCEMYLHTGTTKKIIHDEVIFHVKYLHTVIDNLPSKYK